MKLISRLSAIMLAIALALSTMAATNTYAQEQPSPADSVRDAAAWIASFPADSNQHFGAGSVADAVIALSAADQQADAARDLLLHLKTIAPKYIDNNPGGHAKVLLAADAAGQDARHFLGRDRDLVDELYELLEPEPQAAVLYLNPYIIAIALSRLGEPVPDFIVEALFDTQEDGAFGYYAQGSFHADPDYTAVGISAMNLIALTHDDAEVRAAADASVDAAIGWAQDPANQHTDDDGNYYWATFSSSNSTGMLAGALTEVGVNIESPVAYLIGQQQLTGVGAWQSVHNGTTANMMATTQAILGVAGAGYGAAYSTQVPELEPEPEVPELTVFSAGSRPVAAATNLWGDTEPGLTVWAEVRVGDTWTEAGNPVQANNSGFYVIPVAYGVHTVGTQQWRVGTEIDEGTLYSETVELTRVPFTAHSAGTKFVGEATNTWGTVAPNATVWTEVRVGNNWSRSQTRTATGTGSFVIPLTYGINTPGTTTWRVAYASSEGTTYSNEFTLVREGAVTVTAHSAGTKRVGEATNTWGTAAPNATVWTEVRVGNNWSRSQTRTATGTGSFVIPLTYGINTPGTTTWRVGASTAAGTVYSNTFTLTRTQPTTVTAHSAGTKRVGEATNTWGTAAPNATVWTEVRVGNNWSRSQTRTATGTGSFVIPLTYGANTPGTTTWRVGASTPSGTIYSSTFTLTRTQ